MSGDISLAGSISARRETDKSSGKEFVPDTGFLLDLRD
jgi:hypothetical protein